MHIGPFEAITYFVTSIIFDFFCVFFLPQRHSGRIDENDENIAAKHKMRPKLCIMAIFRKFEKQMERIDNDTLCHGLCIIFHLSIPFFRFKLSAYFGRNGQSHPFSLLPHGYYTRQ